MRIRTLLMTLAALLLLIPAAGAQGSDPLIEPTDAEMVNPQAHISFPPPVYVVSDNVDIRGTANLEGLRNLFIEFRPLSLSAMAMDDGELQWFPATLPRIAAVEDDVLGTWNTLSLPDGLYELRLLINSGDGLQPVARVSPIRVENDPPDITAAAMPADMPEPAAEEPAPDEPAPADDMADEPADDMADEPADDMADEPEVTPTPEDTRPHVVVTVPGANVRRGDSTAYAIVGALREGDRAPIKGVSSWRTGWWYIELPNGRSGFIHPSIVRAEGDTGNIPAVQPPPLPPTPIPLATAVPTAIPSAVNLIIEGGLDQKDHPAKCNETYTLRIRIKNVGTARSGGGLIEVVDSRHDGAGREVTYTAFRELDPGQSQVSEAKVTPKVYHSELHHVNVHVDYDNRVHESNENDNRVAGVPYILQKAGC